MLKHWGKNDETFRKDRRDFLRLGGVAMVGIATTAVAENTAHGIASAFITQPLPILGIGYCNPESAHPDRVIAAEHLSSGDSRFRDRAVSLGVRSFHRAEQHEGSPLSVGLNIHFKDDARFIAWRSAARGSRRTNGSPLKALVAVDENDTLTLSLDSMTQTSPLARRVLGNEETRIEESVATLGFGSSSSHAKLRRGIYIVAFRESARDAAPSWGSLRYDSTSAASPLRAATVIGSRPAPFSYMILSAEYGEKA